jgi:hypothetical protein
MDNAQKVCASRMGSLGDQNCCLLGLSERLSPIETLIPSRQAQQNSSILRSQLATWLTLTKQPVTRGPMTEPITMRYLTTNFQLTQWKQTYRPGWDMCNTDLLPSGSRKLVDCDGVLSVAEGDNPIGPDPPRLNIPYKSTKSNVRRSNVRPKATH